jgi:replicative DNA helicase
VSNNRYIPIDAEAERSVLGAVLTDPEMFVEICDIVSSEDFGVDAHRYVFGAIQTLENLGTPVDRITVAAQLKKERTLQKAGGMELLDELMESAHSAANIKEHAVIVGDKAKLRRLISAGRSIAGDAMAPEAEAKKVLEQAEQLVFELGKTRSQGSLRTMSQAVTMMLSDLEKARGAKLLGHSTGIPELDNITGGLQPGQLVVVAARPAMGKSAFALQMARALTDSSGGMVVPFLSYEMGTSELTMRLLANSLEFDLHRLRQRDFPAEMERDVAVHSERIAQLQIMIDDNPPETISGVRSHMRRLARRVPIAAIVVDYLQLLTGERRSRDDNRAQEVSEISRGLKRLATELEVPVIALSQLNRGLENRPNKRPQLSDLRESGAIEQDASVVMFLYRDAVYNPGADATLAEVIVAKQRNGPTGTVFCEFNPHNGGVFKPTTRSAQPSPEQLRSKRTNPFL